MPRSQWFGGWECGNHVGSGTPGARRILGKLRGRSKNNRARAFPLKDKVMEAGVQAFHQGFLKLFFEHLYWGQTVLYGKYIDADSK